MTKKVNGNPNFPRRKNRLARVRTCSDGKSLFRTYELAAGAAARMPMEGRVYWCARGGGYHITQTDPAEYSRRRTEPIEEEPMLCIDIRLEIDPGDFDRDSSTGLTAKAHDRLEWAIQSAGFAISDGPTLVPPRGVTGEDPDAVPA